MSSVGNILLEKDILLESGTNELEILVFRLADYNFGINVAKVREVLPVTDITSLPKAHPSVIGVFKLRDTVVPCVSLRTHLGVEPGDENSEKTLILTDFNYHQTAFVVDSVERIHRMSWEYILPVPNLKALEQTPVTAVARIEERLIIMLDFEMITDQVTDQFFRTGAIENPMGLPREELRVLMADDSPTVRQAIEATMRDSGYTNLEIFENGEQAWLWLEAKINETGDLSQVADLMISDVEMPRIDGLHLTKRIKEHPLLGKLPVLLYSSIVTPDNRKKGEAVGADAQIAKPELAKVVELADELISKSHQKQNGSVATSPNPEAIADQQPIENAAQAQSESPVEAPVKQPVKQPVKPPAAPVAASVEPSPPPQETPGNDMGNGDIGAVADKVPDTNSPLWYTFRAELGDRARHIRKLYKKIESGEGTEEVRDDMFRTLHTVKSASMVVPVDPATRLTHLIEGLMETTRSDLQSWPVKALHEYLHWVEELSEPDCDAGQMFAKARELERKLA